MQIKSKHWPLVTNFCLKPAGLQPRCEAEKFGRRIGIAVQKCIGNETNARFSRISIAAAAKIGNVNFAIGAFGAKITPLLFGTKGVPRYGTKTPKLTVDLKANTAVIITGSEIVC